MSFIEKKIYIRITRIFLSCLEEDIIIAELILHFSLMQVFLTLHVENTQNITSTIDNTYDIGNI